MKYRYPFDNKKYEVKISNPSGDFSHENFQESKYAIDFILPIGTPVLATRRGYVKFAKFDSNFSVPTKEIENLSVDEKIFIATMLTNIVSINHGDGTFAEYCHLANRKAIKEEQFANRRELIGYVGMSGITDYPHLHFNVFTNKGNIVRSVPVEFTE